MTTEFGLTDKDREILMATADKPNAHQIRAAVRAYDHAERSSRFDWHPDPDKDYCQRCGTATETHPVLAGGQTLELCPDCFETIEARGVSVDAL